MSASFSISIVDDDELVRTATNNLLKSRGYIVKTFASADEFLRSPQLEETSCVIADVQMPVMNGLELLTHTRARGCDAPFIFITSFPDERVRARALSAGATCLLPKPFSGRKLIKCVDLALRTDRRPGA
ncbi:response regulator [Bradyrhizobium sp. ARR65]|uniref:response regulator transcription factor n=1 Tax=Bradyrhizobium sp. ARR65 TaxID=1040989 RepID=UPI000465BFB1|nr:response regulator [Bradyrhizobium sp. ARR65]